METIRDIEYPFVSIIIPVKNEEKYIGKCLDSIFACDYPIEFYEVIVVDNGSSDMSVEIAKQKGAKIFIKPGLPISGLRNVGARESIGEIIVFLDADCLVSSQWIKSAIFIFKQNRNIIACGSSPIFENQTWVQRTWEFSITSNKEINIVSWLPSMNLFVKKKYFIKVKGFDETLSTCEDVDFCYRLKNYGEILSCKNTMIMHMGEPKTLKEFYFRELWRGQSNFRGVLRHGVVLNEIPTLIMPIYIIFIL
jgi:glycosyltransferase involved in cell wall biosynthesis